MIGLEFKLMFSMKKEKIIFVLLVSVFAIHCKNNDVILTRDDRTIIDTTSTAQIVKLSKDLDKWCADSTPVIRQKFIDSLLIARQTEINKRLGR